MTSGRGSMWTKNRKVKKKNDKGATMVTVIVSFALLLIFVTAFYGVQKTSRNMMMSAKDMMLESKELIKAFYLEETDNQPIDDVVLTFRGNEGSFTVNATLYKAQKDGLSGTIYYYDSEQGE